MQVSNTNKSIIKIKRKSMNSPKPVVKLLANISITLFACSTPLMFLFGGAEYIAASQENYESAYSLNKIHLTCKGASMIGFGAFITALFMHYPRVIKKTKETRLQVVNVPADVFCRRFKQCLQ